MPRYSLATALVAFALSSCAAPHQIRDRDDFMAEGTRSFAGESPERIIQAAQAVMRQSDPQDFEFRNSLDGFVGLRRYTIYAVLAASQGREKWDFQVKPEGKTVRASLSITDAGDTYGGYSVRQYEEQMASVALYRLFWSRVEYVLGKRADWVTCDQAAAEAQATNTNTTSALGGLCGPTSDGRNSPPPERLTAS